MEPDSKFGLEISEMLDSIVESGRNKSSQKSKASENSKEKKKIGPFNYVLPNQKSLVTDAGNYLNTFPNFGPSHFEGNRIPPYQNFGKIIEPNTNMPPPSIGPNTMNVDQSVNMRHINQLPGHPPKVNHSGLQDSELSGNQYVYPAPMNIKPSYMPPNPSFNAVNSNQFSVPPGHQENNAKGSLPFHGPVRHPNPFYFNHPVVLPGSSGSSQKMTENDGYQLEKKLKKRRSHGSTSSPSTHLSITPLPPPPSPPNLGPPQSFCHSPKSPHTSPHSFNSPTHEIPPLPSSPPPPDFDSLMNKPPEPKEPPPESPLKDPEDCSSYSSLKSSRKSHKKDRRTSSQTKASKLYISNEDEFLDIKPSGHDKNKSSNDKSNSKKKRKVLQSFNEEDTKWQKFDSHSFPGTPPNPNFVAKRGKYNYLNEPPPPFSPVKGGPPFPPIERPPFTPMGVKPFNPMERPPPPFIGRGRPFNMISRPPPFNRMGTGPPPFHPMGTIPRPFHPMTTPPPFHPIRGGPQFHQRRESYPFHLTEMPPFNSLREGPHFNSLSAEGGYEEEFEYNEFPAEDECLMNIGHNHQKKKKYSSKNTKSKWSKHPKEKVSVEYNKSSKSTRTPTKHISRSMKVKEMKLGNKKVKLKKKKSLGYELEPGEYISDLDSEDYSSTTSQESETDSELSSKQKSDSEDSTNHSDSSLSKFEKHRHKTSKFDRYGDYKHQSSSDSDSSERCSTSDITEKPKYPRYFKDKVAYIADTPKIFEDKTASTCGTKASKEPQIKKKVEDTTKKPLSPPISSESLKATKTPLIKRLGLVENNEDSHNLHNVEKDLSKYSEKENPNGDEIDYRHLTSYNNNYSEKENNDFLRSLHSPSSMDMWSHRNRSNSLSPNNSLDFEEVRLLASTKEILSASKSIFKSPTSPKITTVKKKYEKPIIKIETASKPDPVIKYVESPNRIDLDSRIKILFETRSSGEEDTPEKRNLRNAALSHKSMRLLSRPPSPFRSKNAYQFWHRETYYYRKHNPLPKEFSDPTERRKIGIQIKELNEVGMVDLKVDGPPTSKNSSTENKNDLFVAKEETKSLIDPSLCASHNKDRNLATKDRSEIGDEITKVDVLPDIEMELVSEQSDCRLSESVSNSGNLNKFNSEVNSENDVIKLVISKIIDELKYSIKSELTESIINEKLEL